MNTTESSDFMKEEAQIFSMNDERAVFQHSWDLSLDHFVANVNELIARSASFEITSPRTMEMALDFTAEVANVRNRIETYRKELCKPHRHIIQNVNEVAKNLTGTLDDIKSGIIVKLAKWQKDQEIASLKAKEEAKKISEKLGIDLDIIAPGAPKTLSSSKASTVCKEKLVFVVVNEDLIPDEYWVIEDKLIQKHIDLGKRDIPGIQITLEKNLIVRRKA